MQTQTQAPTQEWSGSCDLEKAAFRLRLYDAEYRELKQQQRRWLGKRHLKSEFVPFQTLSRLFHLVQFFKCWPIVCDIQKQTLTRFFLRTCWLLNGGQEN